MTDERDDKDRNFLWRTLIEQLTDMEVGELFGKLFGLYGIAKAGMKHATDEQSSFTCGLALSVECQQLIESAEKIPSPLLQVALATSYGHWDETFTTVLGRMKAEDELANG